MELISVVGIQGMINRNNGSRMRGWSQEERVPHLRAVGRSLMRVRACNHSPRRHPSRREASRLQRRRSKKGTEDKSSTEWMEFLQKVNHYLPFRVILHRAQNHLKRGHKILKRQGTLSGYQPDSNEPKNGIL